MSHPVLDIKKDEHEKGLPIKRILSPKSLIKSAKLEPLDSLAEGKFCFNECIKPVKQEMKLFEKCLVTCITKMNYVREFTKTNEYIEFLNKKETKK